MHTEKTYYLTQDDIDQLAKGKPIQFTGSVEDDEIELITLIPEYLLPD